MLDKIFNSATLDFVLPSAAFEFPPSDLDEWLRKSRASDGIRKQVFYDEQLSVVLFARIKTPETERHTDPDEPPPTLIQFLLHLQVGLEALYVPSGSPHPGRTSLVNAPPRTVSFGRVKPKLTAPHTPIVSDRTSPLTDDTPRQSAVAPPEGTLLSATIWGQNRAEDPLEQFSLAWSPSEKLWVAMYKFTLPVSFLRLNFADPLLHLAASATLSDKPVQSSYSKSPLLMYLAAHGHAPTEASSHSSTRPNSSGPAQGSEPPEGLEEINLLEGLFAGPTFPASGLERVAVPSTRLDNSFRRQLFSLSPIYVSADALFLSMDPRAPRPVLRQSISKTVKAVSGFRVRMRTVFVPYVLLPGKDSEPRSDEDERDRRELGNEERTVILCVEVENTGEAGHGVGFMVEGADVRIGGEGASAKLVGWAHATEAMAFPLHVGALEQYNLLYAVSFFRSPKDSDKLSSGHGYGAAGTDLQRAVAITFHGKPYTGRASPLAEPEEPEIVSYPTRTFSSRWNCILDLSSSQGRGNETTDGDDYPAPLGSSNALPEPASPFPMPNTPRPSTPQDKLANPPSTPLAGQKRHTLPGPVVGNVLAARNSKSPQSHRTSTPVLGPLAAQSPRRSALSRLASLPTPPPPPTAPIVPSTPTTYSAPIIVESPYHQRYDSPSPSAPGTPEQPMVVPPTPAYPPYHPDSAGASAVAPPASYSQDGLSDDPSVEIRREKGLGMGLGPLIPPTPGPMLRGHPFPEGALMQDMRTEASGEPIVVSVGLVGVAGRPAGEVYPLAQFALDVFVFNRSSWTRRFEVSVPDHRRRWTVEGRKQGALMNGDVGKKLGRLPGVLPLDNRVRIGPLRPSTCQSVRMDFLAVAPGFHTIDALTLTDVESGVSVNLRSVMDIVVREP